MPYYLGTSLPGMAEKKSNSKKNNAKNEQRKSSKAAPVAIKKEKQAAPAKKNSVKTKPSSPDAAGRRKQSVQRITKAAKQTGSKRSLRKTDPLEQAVSNAELAALFEHGREITTPENESHVRPVRQPRWGRWILLAVVGIFILAGGGLLWLHSHLKASLPPVEGSVQLRHLTNGATIARDSLGIPRIVAENEEDLFFSVGYAMAADRLWQMTFLNLLATGRTAEVLGEKTLPLDKYMRTVGLKRYGDKIYQTLPEYYKKLLGRFAAGVNEYIRMAKALPIEFLLTGYQPEVWQPQNSIYLYQFFNFTLATNHIEEASFLHLAAQLGYEKAAWLFPVYDDEPLPFGEAAKLTDVPAEKLLTAAFDLKAMQHFVEELRSFSLPASNNWAVHAKKTVNGKSLLANDTHLQLTLPSAWYVMNLESPTYKAAGVALPGVPLIALGFNGHIAWGATMVMGDNQDLFIEKLKQERGKTYYLDGDTWLPVFELPETYKIKGKNSVTETIQFTKRGPLLNRATQTKPLLPLQAARLNGEYGIALRSAAADGDRAPLGFYQLAKAKNLTAARNALSLIDGICLNVVMADVDNIAWQVTGRYPLRKKGKGMLPSPGFSGEYDWVGYHDFNKNPHTLNPEEGFIATANNRTIRRDSDIQLTNSWYAKERAQRARQLLSGDKKFTVADMHAMHADQVSLFALRLKELLARRESGSLGAAIEKLPVGDRQRAREALSYYVSFDGRMSLDSAAAAVHGAFLDVVAREIFADELVYDSEAWKAFQQANSRSYDPVQDHLLQRDDSPFWDDITTQSKETKDEILARSLAKTILLLEQRLGKVRANWQWGKLHHYNWQHDIARSVGLLSPLLSRGPYPAGGDKHTLNVSSSSWGSGFSVWMIPAMRFVVDYSRIEPAELITHGGISGNPASAHYDDMIVPFLKVSNHPLPLGKVAAEKQYYRVLRLEPLR